MTAWVGRLTAEYDASDARAAALAATLTPSQINWKPAPEVWSIGQCLEHLSIGNEIYLEAIAGALRGRAAAPVDEIAPGWFGRWFIRTFMEPSANTRQIGRAHV